MKHLADKVLLTMWKRAEKDANPLTWIKSRRDLLGLVMPKAQLQAVLDTGDSWQTDGEKHMLACINSGAEVASRLFASCVASQLEKKVEVEMLAAVSALAKKKPEHDDPLQKKHVDEVRCDLLAKCNGIAGFHVEVRCCLLCGWGGWRVGRSTPPLRT